MQDRTEERPPRPGETCSCGRAAVVVFLTDDLGEIPSCGLPHTGTPEPEDIRVERARLALTEYRGLDLGGMTIGDVAGWLGRLAIVLENLLAYTDETAAGR